MKAVFGMLHLAGAGQDRWRISHLKPQERVLKGMGRATE